MPRFFIAVLPPSKISQEIINFQKNIETQFGASHAQKSPPHITIIPPFETEEEKVKKLIETFQKLVPENNRTIQIKLDNFQIFNTRTLFIDVAKNEEFERFCKKCKLLFNHERLIKQRVEKHFFVPHITLANKDLKKKDFKVAWENFKVKEYQRTFELEKLSLLQFSDNVWKIN